MTRSADRLLTSLPKVGGTSRRQQYSASTKKALIEVARLAQDIVGRELSSGVLKAGPRIG